MKFGFPWKRAFPLSGRLGLLVGLAVLLAATSHQSLFARPRFFKYDQTMGLSSSLIYALHQDQQGFLWIGTHEGLNRFDGYEFITFRHDPDFPDSLSSSHITGIHQDKDGLMWITTWGGGLNRFDQHTGRFTHFRHDPNSPDSLGDDFIYFVVADDNDRLWLGTKRGGLCLFNKKTGESKNYILSEGEYQITALMHSAHGAYWVGTNRGLFLFDPANNHFRAFSADHIIWEADTDVPTIDLSTAPVNHILEGSAQLIWIATTKGLVRYNPETARARLFPLGQGTDGRSINSPVQVILEDSSGRLWAGTESSGLLRYDETRETFSALVHRPEDRYSLSSNDVRCLLEDRAGNLWVGANGGGLSQAMADNGIFQHWALMKTDPVSLTRVVSLAADQNNQHIYIGTDSNGVFKVIPETLDTVALYSYERDNPQSLSANHARALITDREARLWVGTIYGLNRLNDEKTGFQRFFHNKNDPDSLPDDEITALYLDRQGGVWVGTRAGLCRYDGKRFTNHPIGSSEKTGSDAPYITTIYQDQSGILWLGTWASGLRKLDPLTKQLSAHPPNQQEPFAFQTGRINSIYEQSGKLWIGSRKGLISMDRESGVFTPHQPKVGPPVGIVYGILGDELDQLWMSTDQGIARFDTKSMVFRVFDIYDGLPISQFHGGTCTLSPGGQLYFGGPQGVTSFYPEMIRPSNYEPPLVFAGFQVNGRAWPYAPQSGETITLALERDHTLELAFAALDYTAPFRNLYRHQMMGVDDDWIESQNQRRAVYRDLKPGTYTFRVKGTNHDQIWSNGNEINLNLRIKAPFYRTWPAFAIYFGVICLLTGLVVHFFRKREQHRGNVQVMETAERLKAEARRASNTFITNMSHEMRTPLRGLIKYCETVERELQDLAKRDHETTRAQNNLLRAKAVAYQQLTQIENLLYLSTIETGRIELFIGSYEIADMMQSVVQEIRPMLQSSRNKLATRCTPEEPGNMRTDLEKVKSILMNLLINANKFTTAGEITLEALRNVEDDMEWIYFRVSDNGIGMTNSQIRRITFPLEDNSQDKTGIGLFICRRFCQMMGGGLEVQSEPDGGASVTVKLPANCSPGAIQKL